VDISTIHRRKRYTAARIEMNKNCRKKKTDVMGDGRRSKGAIQKA
jgi:hypothetical protein